MKTRGRFTRRACAVWTGAVVGDACSGAQQPGGPSGCPRSTAGTRSFRRDPGQRAAGPGLEPFDAGMRAIMDRHGIPGAALAVAKEGKLVFAKGYGWANAATGEAVQPSTLFGLASLSKPITAVATLKLVEQGKLRLDDAVFSILKISTPPGVRMDPRLRNVTVRQCLNHSGGWDRGSRRPGQLGAADLPGAPRAAAAVAAAVPHVRCHAAARFHSRHRPEVLERRLHHSRRGSGSCVRAVYQRFVLDNVLRPMGITRVAMHRPDGRYLAEQAVRHLDRHAGSTAADAAADGGRDGRLERLGRGHGALHDQPRRQPRPAVLNEKTRRLMIEPPARRCGHRPNGTFVGLGWDSVTVQGKSFGFFKDGSYQGMRTFMKRRPNGVCWCLLYNASMDFDPVDMEIAGSTVQEVRHLVEDIDKYPDIDLFKDYP